MSYSNSKAWDYDDAHHIRSAERPEQTLCGQDATRLNVLPDNTTVWPDGNAACWTCWDVQREILKTREVRSNDVPA